MTLRALSGIFIEGKPKELEILTKDVFGRDAKRPSDPPPRSTLKRDLESFRSLSSFHLKEKPGEPQMLMSDLR